MPATLRPPEANQRRQQKRFREFQRSCSERRLNEALNYDDPAQHYDPLGRCTPRRRLEVDYPAGYFIRQIHQDGNLRYQNQRFFIGEILAHQSLDLKPVDERHVEVLNGMVQIRWLDLSRNRLFAPEAEDSVGTAGRPGSGTGHPLSPWKWRVVEVAAAIPTFRQARPLRSLSPKAISHTAQQLAVQSGASYFVRGWYRVG